jgi:hypothetical protein
MLLLDESRSWSARRLAAALDESERCEARGTDYRNARRAALDVAR